MPTSTPTPRCIALSVQDPAGSELPPYSGLSHLKSSAAWKAVPHAPKRSNEVSNHGPNAAGQRRLALRNALRYIPAVHHALLIKEFAEELDEFGHIYMFRFCPVVTLVETGEALAGVDAESLPVMRAYALSSYPFRSQQAGVVQLMIMNNLDPRVAQFPFELVTYGGNGSVFSNWFQYRLSMNYLSGLTDRQTMTLYSGHPMGVFPATLRDGDQTDSPRVVVTNGMVIPNYSSRSDYDRMYLLGVSQYGQMTAGSFCYIGPQGIVHGTTITMLNAGRKYLSCPDDLRGKVFVTAGLGGMSGAQGKAGVITRSITVVAEVNPAALRKRLDQGWISEEINTVEAVADRIRHFKRLADSNPDQPGVAIGFLGNIVELWEYLADSVSDFTPDLGSDQTSLHNPFGGGYYPAGLSFADGNSLLESNPTVFKDKVQDSLRRHVTAINKLAARGMRFWDYGNSFLLESRRAGADILTNPNDDQSFKYPSYVQDIMGDIFSLGFGPFRWVCSSGRPEDLELTDRLAAEAIQEVQITARAESNDPVLQQLSDNLLWIQNAGEHRLVVGSQARILYSDADGRRAIAKKFNDAIADGKLHGPVAISRDHHDVSGTDSPYRETSNVQDGSMFCADMAVHNFVGDSFRGATWVSLHNGGGTGWGEAMNGGFGLVLDGSDLQGARADRMLHWDVNNGIARRAWAQNANARAAIERAMRQEPLLRVTLATAADESILDSV